MFNPVSLDRIGFCGKCSLYRTALRPCVAVTALGEALNYWSDDEPSETRLSQLFRNVASSLPKGGILAFDILVRSEDEPMQYRTWRKGPDWAVLVEVTERREENLLIRDIIVFRDLGSGYRRSEEQHRVVIWDGADVERLLRAAGFEATSSSHYGRYPLAPRRRAFIAHRA